MSQNYPKYQSANINPVTFYINPGTKCTFQARNGASENYFFCNIQKKYSHFCVSLQQIARL